MRRGVGRPHAALGSIEAHAAETSWAEAAKATWVAAGVAAVAGRRSERAIRGGKGRKWIARKGAELSICARGKGRDGSDGKGLHIGLGMLVLRIRYNNYGAQTNDGVAICRQ